MELQNQEKDIYFMNLALKEAKKAFEEDEVPIGCVLVQDGEVIAKGHNQVETLQDATAHAEMLCLTAAFSHYGSWRIPNLELYCTLEPCCMCAGAIFSSRVKRIIWGAKDIRLGACGSFVDLFSLSHPMHKVDVTSGVLEEESAYLMKTFFQKQRKR